jgi:NAD(P)-dependent dehydrogenase (short-subunit alcohol dehydrogenase family)
MSRAYDNLSPQCPRTALVTGGARGIGAAIVTELSARNVSVSAPTRDELDLSDQVAIEQYIEKCNVKDIHFDILINNAAVNIINPLEQISREMWLTTLQVNLNAPFRLAQAFAPTMRRNRWGRIVNLSSILSVVTRPHRAAYSTTKAALVAFTRTLASEFGRDNVLANCVAPGYVDTDLVRENNSDEELRRIAERVPLGRLAHPSEIAKFVSFLCSDENTYITGQTLIIDGGFTCL